MRYKEMFLQKYNYLYKNAGFFNTNFIENDIIVALEQIFLECKPLEEINGYKYLESLKDDKEYFQKYKKSILLNNSINELSNKTILKKKENSIINLCELVYNNIDNEGNNKIAIKKRKDVIDEFARVARYSNDGTIWTSGTYLNSKDIQNYNISMFGMIDVKKNNKQIPIIVKDNEFIEFFSNNYTYNEKFDIRKKGISQEFITLDKDRGFHFTEREKQKIYLTNNSSNNNNTFNYMVCSDLEEVNRPKESKCCSKKFMLKKDRIYMNENDAFLTLCPNCGCINVISKKLIDSSTIDYVINKYSKYEENINYNSSENIIQKNKKMVKNIRHI